MSKRDDSGRASGKCVLWEKAKPTICGGFIKFSGASGDDALHAAVPLTIYIDTTLWFLERLPDVDIEAAHRGLAILTRAIEARKVVRLREGH